MSFENVLAYQLFKVHFVMLITFDMMPWRNTRSSDFVFTSDFFSDVNYWQLSKRAGGHGRAYLK